MFNFLFGKKKEAAPAAVVTNNEALEEVKRPMIERSAFVEDDYVPTEEHNQKEKANSQSGRPIDRIYDYIGQNLEQDGYEDAIVNRGKEYRDQRVKMIRNDFKNLFQSVRLEYKDRIRQLENEIENAEELLIFSTVRRLKAMKETFDEHLTLLNDMEQQLDADDPRMTLMIQTYERGFAKGVMVSSDQFVNH